MAQQAEADLAAALAEVTRQGDQVRTLKALLKDGKGSQKEVDAAIAQLKQCKIAAEAKQRAYEAAAGAGATQSQEAFRAKMTDTLEQRLFYIPSFKIYGGVSGLYDYGPTGCAIKQNITQFWRQHFVLEENMLEVECPSVTPEVVLKASGHVERFTDFMVTDVGNGSCHRADHLLEAELEGRLRDKAKPITPDQIKVVKYWLTFLLRSGDSKPAHTHQVQSASDQEIKEVMTHIEELDVHQLGEALAHWGCKAPETGNAISSPFPFNLMFKTSIGPKGDLVGYLRPETAQGIFVNFGRLLYFNGGKLPFAAAQIGQSFRNEISPKAGLLRVREFTQAEIEHFCNPDDKRHTRFSEVADLQPLLYSRQLQMGEAKRAEHTRLGDAVSCGVIANETLGYFIGRTHLFMLRVGINPKRLRFRQHLQHEMAHYAEDCWDAEVECSYGWVECAGLADRSAYDLRAHAAKSQTELNAYERFPEPRKVTVTALVPNKQLLGKTFKKEAKVVQTALEALQEEDVICMRDTLAEGKPAPLTLASGQQVEIPADMVSISMKEKTLTGRAFTPSVIEPSFGLGRIIYCLLEHTYYTRSQDEQRTVFRFNPLVAPVKATVFPLMQKPELVSVAQRLAGGLRKALVPNVMDTTGAGIGKRYARTDEIGVPFAITVDYDSLPQQGEAQAGAADPTVTLRERDSTAQVRVPVPEVVGVLQQLLSQAKTWDEISSQYPAQQTALEQ